MMISYANCYSFQSRTMEGKKVVISEDWRSDSVEERLEYSLVKV